MIKSSKVKFKRGSFLQIIPSVLVKSQYFMLELTSADIKHQEKQKLKNGMKALI